MNDSIDSHVTRHYGAPDLFERVEGALHRAGLLDRPITPDELAPLDQFHTGGRQATLDLAARLGLRPGTEVLDVGGGIGGAARILAAGFGCAVTVLDLTEPYCRLGAWLTERTGLSALVQFQVGNAVKTPFPDAAFDVAWTQHSTMNVPDKAALYRELFRVLRPGGRLGMHEIMAGPVQPGHFPVPWATVPEGSFLIPVARAHELLAESCFIEEQWDDVTGEASAWFRDRRRPSSESPPPLGLHLLLGERFPEAFANQVRNLEERRVEVIRAVWRKPPETGSPAEE